MCAPSVSFVSFALVDVFTATRSIVFILTTPRSLINNVLISVGRFFFLLFFWFDFVVASLLLLLLLHRRSWWAFAFVCILSAFGRALVLTKELMKIINGLIRKTKTIAY